MRILFTNLSLRGPAGTQVFVRDLALEVQRLGCEPAVYTPFPGAMAEELQAGGIPVFKRLSKAPWTPDVIHGHHYRETLAALMRYPTVPAIFISHDHRSRLERPPRHPLIARYFGPSQICVDRLIRAGIPKDRVGLCSNFVDINRFPARDELPPKPKRALVFSNYANASNYLPVVMEACQRAGIHLETIGAGNGFQVKDPELWLGKYDLVFAKAKAAMEAMVTGAAVILCDFAGLGPMVTSRDFSMLQRMNFGYQALTRPHTIADVLGEIARYDPGDAAAVSSLARTRLSLQMAAPQWIGVYRDIMTEYQNNKRGFPRSPILYFGKWIMGSLETWSFFLRQRLSKLR